MICIPLPARSSEQMLAMMAQAAPLADLVELRLDGIEEPDVERVLAHRTGPVIATNRPAREGGLYHGDERRRLDILEQAARLGADYIDIELSAAGECNTGRARRIISYHDFATMPRDLANIHTQMVHAGADVAKIVGMAHDIRDNLAVFDLLRGAKHPTIALAMGEHGQISRILGRKFGAFLTYGALDEHSGSAPGQLTAQRLREEFRYSKIGPNTDIYGVVANPVAHSLSPAMHNAAFEACGLDAVYVPFLVQDLPSFITAFRALDVKGYSVTIPHKETALKVADEADELARRIGAANTLYRRGDRLLATNTDYAGALAPLVDALGPGATLRGKRVILLGAGGAARALAFGLRAQDARLTVVNRTHERAVALAAEVGAEAREVEALPTLSADIVINTTSVGMHPRVDASPLPRECLHPGMLVFDAVYNPRETRLLREAAEAGCRVVYGAAWLVNQAAMQFELWTDRPAPREVMAAALARHLGG